MINSNHVNGQLDKKFHSSPKFEKDIMKIKEWMNFKSTWRVLVIDSKDIQYIQELISPWVRKVILLDLSKGGEDRVPFPDHHFDAIIFRMSSCLLTSSNSLMLELHRVLKHGGKFMFIDHVLPNDPSHGKIVSQFFNLGNDQPFHFKSTIEWKTIFKKYRLYVHSAKIEKRQIYLEEWIHEHLLHEKKVHEMQELLLDATPRQKQYFSIDFDKERVISLEVDLWIAMFEKE
ncbi:methyltransferase domain-containing protein [Bacillaceae bacterium S4-13-58]